MAAVPPSSFKANSSSSAEVDRKFGLLKQIRSHEVAISELSALSSSRGVYQKNSNLFFRTTIEKASASEQKQIDLAKARLGNLNSS